LVAVIVGNVLSKVVWCWMLGIARRPGWWDVSYLRKISTLGFP